MEYSSKKKEYDKVALQLESERLDLEKEGDLDYESMESLVRDVVKKPKE